MHVSYVPNLSTLLYPLYRLPEKDHHWHWTKEMTKLLIRKVKKLISDEVLTDYDQNLPLCPATDASPYGLGAVLNHVMPNGEERPIAYASRSLRLSEKNFSEIEKESLGIIYGV